MSRLRVLVVDDDRDFAESLAAVIATDEHEVELAHTGEEAVQRSRETDFDAIFMDVKLPDKNGVESFLEIRRLKPDVRVIMMTGFSVEALLDKAIEQGAWAVLRKPFDAERMLAMLASIRPGGILIADDDPDFVASLERVLEHEGFKVLVARNGQEALDRVRSDGIDVLILDLRMPLLSGLEVYLELRRGGHVVPTIVVTAYAREEAEALDRLRALSITGILVKPFDPEELLAILETLDLKRSGDSL